MNIGASIDGPLDSINTILINTHRIVSVSYTHLCNATYDVLIAMYYCYYSYYVLLHIQAFGLLLHIIW